MSRTPVREGFRALHRQRLLTRDTSRSFMVARWNERDLMEVAQLRMALETLSIGLAVTKVSPENLDLLESLVLQMKGALSRRDHRLLVRLDSKFHSALWQIPGNTRLLQALEELTPQIRYFMHLTRLGDEHDYPSMHRELISALEIGDVERAKRKMREHILSTVMRVNARLDGPRSEDQVSTRGVGG